MDIDGHLFIEIVGNRLSYHVLRPEFYISDSLMVTITDATPLSIGGAGGEVAGVCTGVRAADTVTKGFVMELRTGVAAGDSARLRGTRVLRGIRGLRGTRRISPGCWSVPSV